MPAETAAAPKETAFGDGPEEPEASSREASPRITTAVAHAATSATIYAGRDAGEIVGGVGEANQLLERVSELLARHSQHRDHRCVEHLALVPEALEHLQTVLPLTHCEKSFGKAKLLSAFQRCEEAILAASDDCSDDESCKRTLGLAKGLIADMLAHPRQGEVRCRERLNRYAHEIVDLLRSLDLRLMPNSTDKASNGGAGGRGPALVVSSWSEEERTAMNRACEQRFLALQPHTSHFERVESVRQCVEWALRRRFSEGRVHVFGSSAMDLPMPESDIDLTLHLPSRMKLIQELKEDIDSKQKAASMAEEREINAVKLLQRSASMESTLLRLKAALRNTKNNLPDMTQARDRAAQQRDALIAWKALKSSQNGDETCDKNGMKTKEMRSIKRQQARIEKKTKKTKQEKREEEEEEQTHAAPAEAAAPANVPTCVAGITAKQKDVGENAGTVGDARDFKDNEEADFEAKVSFMESRLADKERALQNVTEAVTQLEAAWKEKREELLSWRKENLETPEQKKAVDAILASRDSLEQAQTKLKATSKIVFEMKRVIEREGFTDVMAVHRSRVPVVKTCIPQHLWGLAGRPIECDISVNNLVALHNTRLVKAYTALDPRCRRLLYLVKDWSKARRVNDSSKGTLSSYGHCIIVLHYLTRAGIVPSLLKEHRSLSEGGDGRQASPKPDHEDQPLLPLLVDGIDVSFSNTTSSFEGVPPNLLPRKAPDGAAPEPGCASGGGLLSAGNAESCDLLLGYFRYCAQEFCHAKEVMTLRPKTILKKADVWSKPKLWRTSVEDPFETFDSINPHDLGSVLSRGGQMLLHQEWRRGHAVMRKGGLTAVQELLSPSDKVAKDGRRVGRTGGDAGRGGRGARGGDAGRGGRGGRGVRGGNERKIVVRGQPNHAGRGAGRLWSPADGNGKHHAQQAPLPATEMPRGPGRAVLPTAGMHHQQQEQPLHNTSGAQQQYQQQQQRPPEHPQQQWQRHQHQQQHYQKKRPQLHGPLSGTIGAQQQLDQQPPPHNLAHVHMVQGVQQHPSHNLILAGGAIGGFIGFPGQADLIVETQPQHHYHKVQPRYQTTIAMPLLLPPALAGQEGETHPADGRVVEHGERDGKIKPALDLLQARWYLAHRAFSNHALLRSYLL